MTFRVDDRFAQSEPVLSIPRSQRLAAVGLWTLAGAWSKAFGKDGYVPAVTVAELGGTEKLAVALVTVGLWKTRRTGGYEFVDWARWQETREQADARKRDATERQQRRRARIASGAGKDHAPVTRDPKPRHTLSSPQSSSLPSQALTDDLRPSSEAHLERVQAPEDGPLSTTRQQPVDDDATLRSGLDLTTIVEALRARVEGDVDTFQAAELGRHYLGKSSRPASIRKVTAYVLAGIRNEDTEVLRAFVEFGRLPA